MPFVFDRAATEPSGHVRDLLRCADRRASFVRRSVVRVRVELRNHSHEFVRRESGPFGRVLPPPPVTSGRFRDGNDRTAYECSLHRAVHSTRVVHVVRAGPLKIRQFASIRAA